MGQAESAVEATPLPTGFVPDKLQKHATELTQIVSLTYDNFIESVKELNRITHSFCDINGKQLLFQVKKDTTNSILWKATVRIRCHKFNCRSGMIDSTRSMNLKQYIRLYNEITRQASMAMLTSPGDMTTNLRASVILTELDCTLQEDKEECCICMDRNAEIILGCSHSYCEQCIDEWNFTHKTCPICRQKVQSKDDTWVLTEKPDENEMVYETTGYLMGLADRTGYPSKSPQD